MPISWAARELGPAHELLGRTTRFRCQIGRLVLRRGDWDGRRIGSGDAVRQVTGDAGLPGRCGMGWTNADDRYSDILRDEIRGAGAGDQVLNQPAAVQAAVLGMPRSHSWTLIRRNGTSWH